MWQSRNPATPYGKRIVFLFLTFILRPSGDSELTNGFPLPAGTLDIWEPQEADPNTPPHQEQMCTLKKQMVFPWLMWLSGLSIISQSERSPGWFPVRAHAWVADRSQVGTCARGKWFLFLSHIGVSLFLPPFPSLSINKLIKSLKTVGFPPILSPYFKEQIWLTDLPWWSS